jgi:hypothetical protein
MKRIILLCFIFLVSLTPGISQETTATFAKSDNVLGLSAGVGGWYGFRGYNTQTPVFGLQYDRGIVELGFGGVIGVGGFIGYKGYAYKYGDYKENWNIVIIGARGSFHYDVFGVENLDTYGGSIISFHTVSHKDNIPSSSPYYDGRKKYASSLHASLFVGAKYYFAPSVAGFAELGYGVSWLTMGVAFKF